MPFKNISIKIFLYFCKFGTLLAYSIDVFEKLSLIYFFIYYEQDSQQWRQLPGQQQVQLQVC